MPDKELKKLLLDSIYKQFKDIFSPKLANELPLRREGVDYYIDVKGNKLPRLRIYRLTRQETEAVKAYIDKIIGKGFIKPSTSLYALLVLVVKKLGSRLRICVDYRQHNSITKKNRNALLAIKETLARISKVKINVNNHRAANTTERPKKAWRYQLTLQLFNFIAIK
jgi:hypothetical protein